MTAPTPHFVFIGKVNRPFNTASLPDELPQMILDHHKQYGGVSLTSADQIAVLDHAWVDAEPNCILVWANWRAA